MDNREDVGEYYPGGSVVPAKPEPAAHPVESVNGKAGAVVLTAADVGALPDTTEIPDAEKVSAWGFLKKAWSDLVAAFAAKVHQHTIGQVDGLQSELSTLDLKATGASDLAASAQLTAYSAAQQVSGAYAAANAAELKAGNAFTTAMVADSKATAADSKATVADSKATAADSKATAADSKATAAKSIAEDAQVSADDAVAYAELAVRTAESIVPSRVKNDTDTVRCDGEGNVYEATVVTGGYWTRSAVGWGELRYTYEGWSSYYSAYSWKGGSNKVMYRPSDGAILDEYGVKRASAVANLSPLNSDQLPTWNYSAAAEFTFVYTPQSASFPEEPTDRFARESQLDDKLDKSGGSLSGPLTIGSVTITDTGVEFQGKEVYWLKGGEVAMADDLAYSINMAGTILNRAVNYIFADGTALALRPPSAIEGKIRDFVLRIECTETTTIDWSAFGNCETTGGKSWSDMMLVESGKSYVYRFTDMGGDHLCAAREEIS